MSARPQSAKPSAFARSYAIRPGPRMSEKFLALTNDPSTKAARLANLAKQAGVNRSNFNILVALAGGRNPQRYAKLIIKAEKVKKGKKVSYQNRTEANYERIRNMIVRAALGGNIPNRANIKNNSDAFVLASVLSKNVRHTGTGRNSGFASVMGNKSNLARKIFTMAHPGKTMNNPRTLLNSRKIKTAAYRNYLGNIYWNPPPF